MTLDEEIVRLRELGGCTLQPLDLLRSRSESSGAASRHSRQYSLRAGSSQSAARHKHAKTLQNCCTSFLSLQYQKMSTTGQETTKAATTVDRRCLKS